MTINTEKGLVISPRGEKAIVWTREFNAPKRLVFEAMTKAKYVQRWLLGPEGWSMPVCNIDLRVGGNYRFIWRHAEKKEMGVQGTYLEIITNQLLVYTEIFDQPWYPGAAKVSVTLSENKGTTLTESCMEFESEAARDITLKSGMDDGLIASYERISIILSELQTEGPR